MDTSMNRARLAGAGLFAVGFIGYVVGIYVEYPGRAFSITATIVGVALVAIAGRSDSGESV